MRPIGFFQLFFIFCALVMLLVFATNWILITDDVYYDTFGEKLSFERINEMISFTKKSRWVSYLIIPFLYLVKFFFIAVCISSGAFLLRLEVHIKSIFRIVLFAEFIFLSLPVIKLVWFSFFETTYSIYDLQYFTPLSLLSFFERSQLEPWQIYPLGLVNVFEVAYVLTLSYLLSKIIQGDFAQSFKLVISSYGLGLLVWVIFVMFLTVSLAPA